MYIRKSNNKIHAKYTNEEKERIVLLYLNHQMGVRQIVREFKLYSDRAVYRWVKIYKKYGHIILTEYLSLNISITWYFCLAVGLLGRPGIFLYLLTSSLFLLILL